MKANLFQSNNENKEASNPTFKSQEVLQPEKLLHGEKPSKPYIDDKKLATQYDFQTKKVTKPNNRTQSMGTQSQLTNNNTLSSLVASPRS